MFICRPTSGWSSIFRSFEDNFDFNDIDAGVEVEAQGRAFGRIGLKADLWGEDFAYGYAGVEGYLTGDFWAYYGNTCGDADGDGNNETVSGAAIELGWGWDIKYEYGGWALPDGEGTVPGGTGFLGWYDLLGPSSALQPMLLGPAIVETDTSESYKVKTRPCYPYSDRVNISLSPGGWSGPTSFLPGNQITVSRLFDENPGDLQLGVTNEGDDAGRDIGSSFERTIEIIEPCGGNTNLTVTLTSPQNGDEIHDTLTFAAVADDDFGVERVKFRIDGSNVCNDVTLPWGCTVDVSGYPSGNYQLTARAFGVCGNAKTSAPVTVAINPDPDVFYSVHVGTAVVDPNGTLVGEVTSTPVGLRCASDGSANQCDRDFGEGQLITLHADILDDPIGLGIFQRWIGPDCPINGSTDPDSSFVVTEEVTCVAMFRCDGPVHQCIGGI
ncbi:MAG: Ig-like domain-containing protein [Thermoanaerobaculia bacterium]|nr:Ig-like domain-containing protein [Thermoanaerobaculia bacterium]